MVRGGTERARRRTPEEARAVIAREALRFLSRRPFRDLTVGGLMGGTGLSRPAFYQYFRDLHDLMESLLADLGARIALRADPWLSGEGDPRAALRVSLEGLVQVGVEDGPVLRAVVEAAPTDARLDRAWTAFLAHWDTVVAERIEAQQREGHVAPGDARALARALNVLDAGVLIQAFGRRPHADPAGVLETLHRIWAGTLYAPVTNTARPPGRAHRTRASARADQERNR